MRILASRESRIEAAGVVVLLLILGLQLFLSVRQMSQTWDEGDHIYSGYMSWKTGDHGLNPEHPPLAKLLATIPILPMTLNVPQPQDRFFKEAAFLGGKDFLYGNDADAILIRTRMAVAMLTMLCAILLFAATREMFGKWAAFIALGLFAFDPNILAHGAVVTTDLGLCCFMFATVYAFYRYAKAPSWKRLSVVGVALGLALAVKHSAVTIVPMLFILALIEIVRGRIAAKKDGEPAIRFPELRQVGALAIIGLISFAILWSFYGFRFQARPDGLELSPSFGSFTHSVPHRESRVLRETADFRILPESYLYGMADILMNSYPSYVFEKAYPKSVWFYFPAVFVIKSTIGFLGLFLLIFAAIAARRLNSWREVLFLTVPPILYFLVAMKSGTNIGVRHILPVYVFLFALAGAAAGALIDASRKFAIPVGALLLFHVVSSVAAFPYYIPYSNEFWGGSANTYKLLSDSNADWGEQLKETKAYLDARGVKDCWFLYFAGGVADPGYYGIPCKLLPTVNTLWVNDRLEVPPSIEGPVLISAANLSGFEFGPRSLNPYEQFRHLKPTAVIGRGIFVFDGRFDVPQVSALWRIQNSGNLIADGKKEEALAEAQAAVSLDPESASAHMAVGDALRALKRDDEAKASYEKALELAKSIEPEFQASTVRAIERILAGSK